jgi:VIT1/CCC1 family predicted Fe2+/Mn2+ transporter
MSTAKLEHNHSVEAIRERISQVRSSYLRDWIYGGIDGTITTFAVVSGVAGAGLSPIIVLILGFANLIADGFSMAASNFVATRSEIEDYQRREAIERKHIEFTPEGEREEVRQIYLQKGFQGADLEKAVDLITSDKERWIKTMLLEEYGLPTQVRSPVKAASSTFTAFVICGFIPLIPYLFTKNHDFTISAILTGIDFFIIGSIKSIWNSSSWFRSGMETFLIGTLAASLAYFVGLLLKGLTS